MSFLRRCRCILEDTKLFLNIYCLVPDFFVNGDHIESDGLRQRSALPNGNDIALTKQEARGTVSSNVLVTLLVSLVLPDVLQVATTDNHSAFHLGGHNNTLQNAATDRDVAGEWTLLVDVRTFDSSLGGFVTESDVLGPATILDRLPLGLVLLRTNENGVLLLECLFGLV